MRRSRPLLLLFTGTLFACRPSKADVSAYLESQGLTKIELQRKGNAFEFTATDSATGDLCTGTVTLSKGFVSTNRSLTKTCGFDTGACKPGAPEECVRIADKLYAEEATIFPTEAAQLYRMACADKNGYACTRSAEFEAIQKDFDKLRSFASQACDLGEADGCRLFGLALMNGDGGPPDTSKGAELLKRGCENPKPSLHACRDIAATLLDRKPPDGEGAKPYAEKACAANIGDGCVVHGVALFRSKDYASALPKLESGCSDPAIQTRGLSCNLAGAIYFDGLLVGKKDKQKGLALFEKSCEANAEDGCQNAARSYEKGLGTARDSIKAKEFAQKACKARGGTNCG